MQDEIRAIIGNAAGIIPPKIKATEFQDVLDTLFPPKMTTSPPKGTTDEELLTEYLTDYLKGAKAENFASFKSGATLIEDGEAYFVYKNFYNSLKNKDWKIDKSITAEIMTRLFKADFGILKRFPKKKDSDPDYTAVRVTQVPANLKELETAEPELIPITGKDDIF